MPFMIQVVYDPIAPNRRSHTHEIAAAIRALAANPTSPEGVKGSFVIPAKHLSAAFTAAKDCGVAIKSRRDGENVRVMLR